MRHNNIPVLYITFSRPEYARQSFDAIKNAKPEKLYFYSNKGREGYGDEFERNMEVRALVNEVNWDCELLVWFRDEYVNVYESIRGAINWVFENEEQAIILEEDCVATLGFFSYAEQLLVKYKNDKRIWLISGNNFINYNPQGFDYIFSHHFLIYGWASWRDRWQMTDWKLDYLDKFINNGNMNYLYPDKRIRRDRISNIRRERSFLEQTKCWDGIFYLSMERNNSLCIFPKEHLVTNIGISGEHNKTGKFYIWNTPANYKQEEYSIEHEPQCYFADSQFDDKMYSVTWKRPPFLIYQIMRIVNRFRRIYNRI